LSVPEHLKLQYGYEGSPICVADGTPIPAPETLQFAPSTRPGSRAPHAWLEDGRSTIRLFGDGFVLPGLGRDPPDTPRLGDAARARGLRLRDLALADPEIAALYEQRLVLVRPDGHVAWHGNEVPADAAAVIDRVRGSARDENRGRPQAEERLE